MNYIRPPRQWQIGRQSLVLGATTRLLAIINLTQDSFYAGSRHGGLGTAAQAIHQTIDEAIEAGADLIDLGAESTRPGAAPVDPAAERARLLPALTAARRHFPRALLSVDTRHASTARAALAAGADVINDVSGLDDPEMAPLLAASDCGVILMHHRGAFQTMHRLPPLADPVGCVTEGLANIIERARAAGIADRRVVLDPGFGFGKNLDENFPLLAHFDQWRQLGFPLLAGLSRKSFLGHAAQRKSPEDRLFASLAAATAAVLAGAHLLRVHDVAASRDAACIADRLLACA